MAHRVWAEYFLTADMSSSSVATSIYQPVSFDENIALKAIRTSFVLYNNPTISAFYMRVFSNISNAPGDLMYMTTNLDKNSVTSYANADMEIYLEFSSPIHLKGGDTYHFCPWFSGYTGTASSHCAWVKGYPDPTLPTANVYQVEIATLPFKIGFIGDRP